MVYELMNQWVKELKEYKIGTWATTILFIIFIGVLGQRGYIWQNKVYEQKSQNALSEAIEEYHRVMQVMLEEKATKDILKQRFEDTHISFNVIHNSYKNSLLNIPCYAFQANAYWYAGNIIESEKFLQKAIERAKKSPLYYVYLIKEALMLLDCNKEVNGLEKLTILAYDKKNPQQDIALYYLGFYYFSKNDLTKAYEVWTILINEYGEKKVDWKLKISPYAHIVKNYLDS